MLERKVENAVISAIRALGLADIDIDGLWTASETVKGVESSNDRAILRVVAAPRTFDTFSSTRANFTVAIALSVRQDTDPTGAAFAAYASAIIGLLQDWQLSIKPVKAAFTFDGFAPSGFHLQEGDSGVDRDRKCWITSHRFTLRGIIKKG